MYNLLIIDDDPIFEFIAEKTISRSNFFNKTTFFKNGKEALNYLEQNKSDSDALPDLILLDIYMPVLNGWDFIKRFEEINKAFIKEIPVYVLTSSIDPNDHRASTTFPSIQSFVSKPLTKQMVEGIYGFCQEWYHKHRTYAN